MKEEWSLTALDEASSSGDQGSHSKHPNRENNHPFVATATNKTESKLVTPPMYVSM